MVVFGQTWLYSSKNGSVPSKWLYLGRSCYNRAKQVVFGQKLLYSGNMVLLGQGKCIRAKWLFSGKSVF